MRDVSIDSERTAGERRSRRWRSRAGRRRSMARWASTVRRRKAGRAARRERPRRHAARAASGFDMDDRRRGHHRRRPQAPLALLHLRRARATGSSRTSRSGEIITLDHEVQLPGRDARHGRRGAKAAPAQLDVDRHGGQGRRHLADGGHGADPARGPDPADHARRQPHDFGDGRELSDRRRATSASPTPRS